MFEDRRTFFQFLRKPYVVLVGKGDEFALPKGRRPHEIGAVAQAIHIFFLCASIFTTIASDLYVFLECP
jgi:hypothetical protein